MDLRGQFLPQLDELIAEYEVVKRLNDQSHFSDSAVAASVRFITRARAAVARMTRSSSPYARQCEEAIAMEAADSWKAVQLLGVLGSLKADVQGGYLETASGLIRGELFADFIEMAEHLLQAGYKDPAAVVAGSALEAHLRGLCERGNIAVEVDGRYRKAEALNADLAKAEVYTKLDQKSVTSWLGLRNDAAHGNYANYTAEQVTIMIAAIRDFITRCAPW